jgi:hypothetical protein
MLHALVVFGSQEVVELKGEQNTTILDVLCNSDLAEKLFGKPTVIKTANGIRFPTQMNSVSLFGSPFAESHRDQVLATFAVMNIPLDQPIFLDRTKHRLYDVLQDSIANFHLDQFEIDWTIIALAIFLPTEKENWNNKFKERFTFDDCAKELMRRGLAGTCCGGCHRLHAIRKLLLYKSIVLSADIRGALIEHERDLVKRIVASQNVDGSWDPAWFVDELDDGNLNLEGENDSILITGHILEWLFELPPEIQPHDECFQRAFDFLSFRLRNTSNTDFESNFCPYTHVLLSLRKATCL